MGFFANLLVSQPQLKFQSDMEEAWYDTLIAAGGNSKDAYQIVLEERQIARNEAELPNPFGGKPENYWAPQNENPAGVYGAAWPPGTFAAPPSYGETLLAKQNTDPRTRTYLEKLRLECVLAADIIWFWNMESVNRIIMMHLFTLDVGAFWCSVTRQTGSAPQARLMARKVHPCFGNPDDRPGSPDSPIPVELLNRINIYSHKRRLHSVQQFNNDIDNSTTFNALIRREIRAGNL
jgi:hypothetical protein